jgi:hypothetical protein
MKEIYLQTHAVTPETVKQFTDKYRKRLRKWTLALYFSVVPGIIFAIAGLVFGAVSYLGLFTNAKSVNQIGNLMIIAAFPLMMFGAHALDKINEIKFNRKQPDERRDFSSFFMKNL